MCGSVKPRGSLRPPSQARCKRAGRGCACVPNMRVESGPPTIRGESGQVGRVRPFGKSTRVAAMSDLPVIRQADLIVRAGRIHTLDAAGTVASSLAVVGDEIAAVGDDRETAVLLGPSTEVVDLGGRTVVPGLHDS